MGVANIKLQGKINERCIGCFLKTYQRLFKKFDICENNQQSFISFLHELVNTSNCHSSPEIQRLLNRKFCQIIEADNPFKDEKTYSNRLALELYNGWKQNVQESKSSFNLALRLAIAGNIMDYGVRNSFNLEQTIERVLLAKFAIDHSSQLEERLLQAKSVLYIGDNAGEIVFDRLLIETINHPNLVYAVRGGFVLNDATMEDAYDVGLDKVVRVISSGFDAPSTIVDKSSLEFQRYFNEADLIISKGQGNLEGLLPLNDNRIFFLLMVKCDVIADLLSVPRGSFVVYNSANVS